MSNSNEWKEIFENTIEIIKDLAETCPNDLFGWECGETCYSLSNNVEKRYNYYGGHCWRRYLIENAGYETNDLD